MDPLSISAASGLRARMESLELLANNIANASTDGFKSDREFYSLYVSPEAADAGASGYGASPDTLPVIEKPWIDYAQGTLRSTGNQFDLALSGKGFFSVNGPSGPLYTRSGNFQLSSAGILTTAEGYPVRTADGGTLAVQPGSPIEVARDGNVLQNGQDLGQLAVGSFNEQADLNKQGMNYFFKTDPKTPVQTSTAEVQQGSLEKSNVGSAESAVRLVSIMRQFEMLQKAVTIGAEMNRHAVEEVARVTS